MAWHIHNKNTELKTGDILETSSQAWYLSHFAVVFYRDGIAYVTHLPLKSFNVTETFEEFNKKRTIFRYFRNEQTEKVTNQQVEQNIQRLANDKWDVMVMNCEDYVKYVTGVSNLGLDLRIAIGITVVVIIVVVVIIIKIKRK